MWGCFRRLANSNSRRSRATVLEVVVVAVEDLERHLPIRIRVVCPVHRRVSAVAEYVVDHVMFKLLAGREHILRLGV